MYAYVCVYICMCVCKYICTTWRVRDLFIAKSWHMLSWRLRSPESHCMTDLWESTMKSPQWSSYLTANTKIGVNAMPSNLKAERCEPEKSGCFHLSLKNRDQCSSSSRGSGFPLLLTHRPDLYFYPDSLVEVYPLRRAYILFSLPIKCESHPQPHYRHT